MSLMTTAGYMGDRSPDRVDALVWALTELREGLGGVINVSRETAKTFGAAMAKIGRQSGPGGLRFGGL